MCHHLSVLKPGGSHRSDIEGLRAVAVLLVVAYHAGVTRLSGGYVGVDVFFVISGFLITNVLIRSIREDDSIPLREFWARRFRRLLPMSTLVAATTLFLGMFMLEEGRLRNVAVEVLGAFGFSANLVLYFQSSVYLSGVTLPSPVQHFWSLAVEEQFYLVWPLLLLVILRTARHLWKVSFGAVIVMMGGASLIVSMNLTRQDPGGGYYLPHARAWEILAGAGLGMAWTRLETVPRSARSILGWSGVGLIVWSALVFDAETMFPGHAALAPVLGAVAVLIAADAPWGPNRILSVRPAQWLGARSYSLYLWHWPALVLFEARFGTPSMTVKVLIILGCIALSALSYEFVEQPIRHHAWLSAKPIRTIVAGFVTVSLAVGCTGVAWAAAPAARVESADPDQTEQLTVSTTTPGTVTLPSATTTLVPPDTTPIRALLLGDSVLAGLRWWVDASRSLKGFEWVLDAEPCRRLLYYSCLGREERNPTSAVGAFRGYEEKFDVVVVLAGYHSRDGQFEEEVTAILDEVRASGAKVVFMSLKETLEFPAPGSRGKKSMYESFNRRLVRIIEKRADPGIVLADWNYFSRANREWFRSDNMHTGLAGTLAMGWFISNAVAAAMQRPCPYDGRYPCTIPETPEPTTNWLTYFSVPDTRTRCFEMGASRTKVCRTG